MQWKKQFWRYATVALGAFISGVGINTFLIPHQLFSGGVSGVAMILYFLFSWPIGIQIILFTDQWASPVAKAAAKVFRVHIEAPSAWDSSVVTLFIVEALIEAVQSSGWEETSDRMKTLEGLFEASRLFRKPRPEVPGKS